MNERSKKPAAGRRRKKLKRPLPPAKQLEQQERRSTGRRLLVMGVFVLVTLFLTLAMIRMIIKSTAPEPKLYIVQEGSIVSEIYDKALLVRNEVVLDSPAAGVLLPNVNDGDKVRKDQVLGRIISSGGEDLWDKLEEIKYRISTRQLELMADGELGRAESLYLSADDKLLPLVNQIRRGGNAYSLPEKQLLAERMQIIVNERNERLMDYTGNDEKLLQLFAEKEEAEEELADYAVDLKSPLSGLVSFAPDSLSGEIDAEKIMEMSPAEVKSLMENASDAEADASRKVSASEDVAFLLRDIYQYIVFILPDRQVSEFPLNNLYDIEFPDEGIMAEDAELEYADADKDQLLLVFKTDKELAPLINRRYLNAKINLESERGLKVPKEALIFPEEHNSSFAKLMIVRSGYVYAEQVEVLKMDEKYAIVASPIGAQNELSVGSIVVQNPASAADGEQLGG